MSLTPSELLGRQKILEAVFSRLLNSEGKYGFTRKDLFKHSSQQSKKFHWQLHVCDGLIERGIVIRSGPTKSPTYTFSNTEAAQEELVQLHSFKIEDLARHPTMLKRRDEPNQETLPELDRDASEQDDDIQEIDVPVAVANVSKAVYAISETIVYVRQVQERNEKMLMELSDGLSKVNKNLESLSSLIELFLNATQNTDPTT